MAHYARVNSGVVEQVIVAELEFIAEYVSDSPGEWLQTSYNTMGGVHYGQDGAPDGGVAFRKNFASSGFSYDSDRDAFIPPRPFPSWSLIESSCTWEPPSPVPDDELFYEWSEETLSWIEQSE